MKNNALNIPIGRCGAVCSNVCDRVRLSVNSSHHNVSVNINVWQLRVKFMISGPKADRE
jgi:hypothetical protein